MRKSLEELGVSIQELVFDIAVVGVGYWGAKCVATIASSFPWASIHTVDPQVEPDDPRLTEFDGLQHHRSIDAMLSVARPNMAIIATPAALHGEFALRLLHAGVSVLVEKPFGLNKSEIEEARNLVSEEGLVVSAGYLYVHNPIVKAAKETIESGRFGELLFLESLREGFGAFRRDVNVVRDLMVHDISICLELMGGDEIYVRDAHQRLQLGTGHHAEVEAYLSAGERVGIKLLASHARPRKTRRTTLIFEQATMVLDENDSISPVRTFKTPEGLLNQNPANPWLGEEYAAFSELEASASGIESPRRTLLLSLSSFIHAVLTGSDQYVGIDFAERVNSLAENVEAAMKQEFAPR